MSHPVLPTSQRLDPHTLSREYVQGVLEGYLAAQPTYRCLRPWHLEAMSRRLGEGADAVIKALLADGTLLNVDPSWMPGVFSLHGGVGYVTVRALQELAADCRLPSRLQDAVAAYLTGAGHPVAPARVRTGDAVTGFRDGHLLGSSRRVR
jgi:hypothetical protein